MTVWQLGVECLSTVAGGTCNPKRETLVMTTVETVTEWATTNYSYTVVTTNDLGSVTNVLTRPHPPPYPDTMTGYWTNAAVTAWSVTNTVPAVGAAITNNVSTNAFLAPGDTIFTPASDTFRCHKVDSVTVWQQKQSATGGQSMKNNQRMIASRLLIVRSPDAFRRGHQSTHQCLSLILPGGSRLFAANYTTPDF